MEIIVGIAVLLLIAGIAVAKVSRRRADKRFGGGMVAAGLLVLVLAQLAVSTG